MKKARSSQRKFYLPISLLLWIVGISIIVAIFLFYGPYDSFRVFWITTAMHSSDHQYLATTLYPAQTIRKIMRENSVAIPKDRTSVESEFSSQPDPGMELIEISLDHAKGYLMIVKDPSRVRLAVSQSTDGMLLEDIVQQSGARAAINASAYRLNRQKGTPLGLVIADGQVISPGADPIHSVIGFDVNHQLVVGVYSDREISGLRLRDAVEYGPFMVINGQPMAISGNGGGIAPRTAIGQTRDGVVLMLVFEGRTAQTFGATLLDVQNVLIEYGAVQAACLDGGYSTTLYYQDAIVNSIDSDINECLLPNAFVVH